jgi:hypothetical protein
MGEAAEMAALVRFCQWQTRYLIPRVSPGAGQDNGGSGAERAGGAGSAISYHIVPDLPSCTRPQRLVVLEQRSLWRSVAVAVRVQLMMVVHHCDYITHASILANPALKYCTWTRWFGWVNIVRTLRQYMQWNSMLEEVFLNLC